jgi:hypothetical protein
MSELPNGHSNTPIKTLSDYLNESSSKQTFENMKKLCLLSEYEIPKGSGIKYKRKMLKPKDLIELNKLQNAIDEADPEKRMDNIKQQAMICLDGITDEKWEETDAVLMEITIGACVLISKGFQPV